MSVSELIKTVNAAADSPHDGIPEAERVQLIAACKKLQDKLETPREKTFEILMAPHLAIAIRLGVDMKLFDLPGPSTVEELASQTGADYLLVTRVIRLLTASSLFTETPSTPPTYTPTPLSSTYASTSPWAQAIIHLTTQIEPLSALPRYFQKTGYISPGDAFNGPFQFARNTDLHAFEWVAKDSKLQMAMNVVMKLARQGDGGREWCDVYPVEEKLVVQNPEKDVVIVDVGGGLGQVLISLKEKFPFLQGRMVVQDLPVVIESIKPGDLPNGIEAQGLDFFKEQPVKGAKAYYLRAVLHDWPDKQASQILEMIREAMNEESVVLINENAIPEYGVSLLATQMDFNMMTGFASLERTERQWRALLESAGLELVKVWSEKGVAASVFEAILKR